MADNERATGSGAAPGGGDGGEFVASDERAGTLIFAAILTLFGLFWIYAASDLPSRQQTAYLTQGFLPTVAGILLAALSAILFVTTWRRKPRPPEELGHEPLFERGAQLRGAAVFAALLAYIVVLPHIHYLISTFFLMLVGLALAREPFRPRLFIIAAVTSALFFAIFVWGLDIALPGSRFG
jgi:ABC-type glycerol-3-phosphate transport system permease component